MTVAIDKAIQTRWTATSLDSTVTGGLWFGLAEDPTTMPYASYTVVSDATESRTSGSRYNRKTMQIQCWDTTPDLVGAHIETIEDAFVHSDRAATNPLVTLLVNEVIKDVEIVGGPTILQEADEVWQAVITLEILYAKDRVLIPS
jgi:hypothetical protein